MTIFAVLMSAPQPAVEAEIKRVYEGNYLQLSPTQWLISANKTVIDVSNSIGVSSLEPNFTPKGSAVVFATSSYFGRAPTSVWDWIKVKLEGPGGG